MAKQMRNKSMNRNEVFRVHEDSSILCTWSTGKYTLCIIYDVNKPHLSSSFSTHSEESLGNYIKSDVSGAFFSAIDKIGDNCYEVNIASNVHFYGVAGDGVYANMLNTFLPIIQKFMVDALTDNLYIIEDGKLVKQ
jgi:hypothetical protein